MSNDQYIKTLMSLADSHLKAGRAKEYLETLRNALSHNPDSPKVNLKLGKGIQKAGDLITALNYYQKAVCIYPFSLFRSQ